MKTLNGIPTKKAFLELCEKHDFTPHALSQYTSDGRCTWSSGRNARAMLVVAELQAEGFNVEVSEGDPKFARTGSLHILPKTGAQVPEVKIRLGMPTGTSVKAVCDYHGLPVFDPKTCRVAEGLFWNQVSWNKAATKVADTFLAAGLQVEFRKASAANVGSIQITHGKATK